MTLRLICLSLFCFCLSFGLCLPSASADLKEIQEALSKGKAKASLKKLDTLLAEAIALRVDALSQLKKAQDALRSYEILVQMREKEDFALLQKVSWSYLFDLLKKEDAKAHRLVAEFLGSVGDTTAVKPLLPLLKSSDFLTRFRTAEALGKLGDKSAVKPIARLLKDENPLVKVYAAWALAKLGDKRGERDLKACFKSKPRDRILFCAQALARLGNDEVKGYLTEQMTANSNRRARAEIAVALAALKDDSWAKPMLADLTSTNAQTRLLAARYLGELGHQAAKSELEKLLKDSSIPVQIAAAQSLGQLDSSAGRDTLLGLLKHSQAQNRIDASFALSFLKGDGLAAPLKEALKDPHLLVRVHAAHALVKNGSQEGTSAFREALDRGDLPMQAFGAQYALLASKVTSALEGKPIARTQGTLPAAKITSAFGDSASSSEEPESEPKETSDKPADRRAAPSRRPPPRRDTGTDPEW